MGRCLIVPPCVVYKSKVFDMGVFCDGWVKKSPLQDGVAGGSEWESELVFATSIVAVIAVDCVFGGERDDAINKFFDR